MKSPPQHEAVTLFMEMVQCESQQIAMRFLEAAAWCVNDAIVAYQDEEEGAGAIHVCGKRKAQAISQMVQEPMGSPLVPLWTERNVFEDAAQTLLKIAEQPEQVLVALQDLCDTHIELRPVLDSFLSRSGEGLRMEDNVERLFIDLTDQGSVRRALSLFENNRRVELSGSPAWESVFQRIDTAQLSAKFWNKEMDRSTKLAWHLLWLHKNGSLDELILDVHVRLSMLASASCTRETFHSEEAYATAFSERIQQHCTEFFRRSLEHVATSENELMTDAVTWKVWCAVSRCLQRPKEPFPSTEQLTIKVLQELTRHSAESLREFAHYLGNAWLSSLNAPPTLERAVTVARDMVLPPSTKLSPTSVRVSSQVAVVFRVGVPKSRHGQTLGPHGLNLAGQFNMLAVALENADGACDFAMTCNRQIKYGEKLLFGFTTDYLDWDGLHAFLGSDRINMPLEVGKLDLLEAKVPAFHESRSAGTLRDIGMRAKANVNVIAVIGPDEEAPNWFPRADARVECGSRILVPHSQYEAFVALMVELDKPTET